MTDYEQAKIDQMQQFNNTFRNIAESVFYIGNYFLTKEAELHVKTTRKKKEPTLKDIKKKMDAERIAEEKRQNYFKPY